MTKIRDIDEIMAKAREKSLEFIAQSEDQFIEDALAAGSLTFDEALSVVRDHGPVVQEALAENMTGLRAWLERGATDLN